MRTWETDGVKCRGLDLYDDEARPQIADHFVAAARARNEETMRTCETDGETMNLHETALAAIIASSIDQHRDHLSWATWCRRIAMAAVAEAPETLTRLMAQAALNSNRAPCDRSPIA